MLPLVLSFKSYYVVWKLLPFHHPTNLSNMFKSYYVVWKHPPVPEDIGGMSKFKSYYVVWKRYFEGDGEGRADGLNRTM